MDEKPLTLDDMIWHHRTLRDSMIAVNNGVLESLQKFGPLLQQYPESEQGRRVSASIAAHSRMLEALEAAKARITELECKMTAEPATIDDVLGTLCADIVVLFRKANPAKHAAIQAAKAAPDEAKTQADTLRTLLTKAREHVESDYAHWRARSDWDKVSDCAITLTLIDRALFKEPT